MTTNTDAFRQLMEEVKSGATSTEEAAARIDAHCAIMLERALKERGIEPVPNAEQRLFRDMHNLSRQEKA
jgi:hypothetical protein